MAEERDEPNHGQGADRPAADHPAAAGLRARFRKAKRLLDEVEEEEES